MLHTHDETISYYCYFIKVKPKFYPCPITWTILRKPI